MQKRAFVTPDVGILEGEADLLLKKKKATSLSGETMGIGAPLCQL